MAIDYDVHAEVEEALASGKGLLSYSDFIKSDGSIRDIQDREVRKSNDLLAAIYATFPGFVENSEYNQFLLSLLSNLSMFIPVLYAVAATAPSLDGLAVGELYFNTTDKKLYEIVPGATEEDPNEWDESDAWLLGPGKLWFVFASDSAGFYRFVTDTLVLL